ncbi:MAG TPA: VWA domain-containing protein [Ignavibacteriaceae bacterium]|nr:VWA domain-containing protein [Ignavibacteriaceae bacterium]
MFNFDFSFAYPYFLLVALVVPFMVFWHFYKGKKTQPGISFSMLNLVKDRSGTLKERFASLPFFLRLIGLLALVIALARPQSFSTGENVYTEGIDIVLVLDISGSMLAEDFKPNRLEAAKRITDNFIEGRISDQIGLVIFSRDAFTQCPLTIDYSVLRNQLNEVKSGMIEDGTAIGNAIANGINRLKDSKSNSKVMVLLTDGVNNAGEVNQITAAEIANKFGIRIYTIGVGTMGQAPYPFQTPFGVRYQMVPVEIDEPVLKQIAGMTGGKYFRATNNKKLEDIYTEIDKLEKTRVEVTSFRSKKELFFPWLISGLFLVFFDFGLSRTLFRRLP